MGGRRIEAVGGGEKEGIFLSGLDFGSLRVVLDKLITCTWPWRNGGGRVHTHTWRGGRGLERASQGEKRAYSGVVLSGGV